MSAHARGFVHGCFLRLKNLLLQNGAILRNAARIGNMAETSASATVRKPMKSRAKTLAWITKQLLVLR